ncbi:ABC transporter ATP-binding protein [[Clostridium] polysaccharolyticum]|uniref:Energy-coupling factor transport system ATP-binding protein n=1 Tax=[Clostridium] polysaccharolyticum TaxID=29364 RepID=A0A1I0AA46_9FIRM|nr:ABC transporter ATP-binding protein [[Clostridium] polysaccharolyticum]SES90606.1 energy-coupling factor transport system ATP-binding protein [[Clostridium] polysaccharolyticum]
MAQIKIEDLCFSYPQNPEHKILNHISFEIQQGEYIAFCGRSGSGKSTLLRHCKSVLTPAGNKSGEIYIKNKPLASLNLREQTEGIGYVMQNPDYQIVTDKVWHELAFGLESLGVENQIIRRRVGEMASYFGIQNWFHKDVKDLSGGEKQLLNLASVMVMQPDILILDEPTSQLDPIAAADFLQTVHKINLDFGTTILLSEHRLEEVLPYADKAAVLDKGSLIVYDSPSIAAQMLWKDNHTMFRAFPSAAQIFYKAGGTGTCPLTVREGRNWFHQRYAIKHARNIMENVGKKDKGKKKERTAIQLKDVWFRYGNRTPDVLKGVSFEIAEGDIVAIVGGNGSGKSTALKIMAGLLEPQAGKVLYYGKDLRKKKTKWADEIALLPQDPLSLFVKRTVREELVEMTSEQEELEHMIKFMDISSRLDNHPYDLSGGEQQRVALAKLLLAHPRILLLDEPTKGMDIVFKQELGKFLKTLSEQKITILLISHDIEFCADYADFAGLFFDGKIIAKEEAHEFFASNYFYTTAANRIARGKCPFAVTMDDVVRFCMEAKEGVRREEENYEI